MTSERRGRTPGPGQPQKRAETLLRRLQAIQANVRERRALVALALLFVAFLSLALVAKSPGLRHWDSGLSQAIQGSLPRKVALPMAVFLTVAGNGWGLALCGLPAAVWLWRTRRPRALALLYASIGGHLLNIPLKLTVLRPRPNIADDVEVLYRTVGSSFPSGHAMTAVMFFGFWAFLVGVHVARPERRHVGVAVLVLAAMAVCWSRVYVGNHFVSDIVGGAAAGLFFLFMWGAAYRSFGAAELAPPPRVPEPRQPE